MTINKTISILSEALANTTLDVPDARTTLSPLQEKTDDCFKKVAKETAEPVTTVLKGEMTKEILEIHKPSDLLLPQKFSVLFYDPMSKIDVKGVIVRKADEEDISFTAYREDDLEHSSGTISVELMKDCLWIHTMKNSSENLLGIGKSLIQVVKQEAALQNKGEIGLIAIGNSHAFYSSCGFITAATNGKSPTEATEMDTLLKSACATAKKTGVKADTSYLGTLEMVLKL